MGFNLGRTLKGIVHSLSGIVPDVALALSSGNPVATKLISGIFRKPVEQITEDDIKNLPPEMIVQLKREAMEMKGKILEANMRMREAEIQDLNSARDMAKSFVGSQSWFNQHIHVLLTFLVFCAFFTGCYFSTGLALDARPNELTLMLFGSLTTSFGMCMSFWFGTTRAGDSKSQVIHSMLMDKTKQEAPPMDVSRYFTDEKEVKNE